MWDDPGRKTIREESGKPHRIARRKSADASIEIDAIKFDKTRLSTSLRKLAFVFSKV
jgi:hypothetical protein